MARVRLVVFASLVLLLVPGCSGTDAPGGEAAPSTRAASSTRAAPHLGGPSFTPARVPHHPMSSLEKPIVARLAHRAAGEGLTVDYLDCPRWGGAMPHRLTCTAWFDGVTAPVLVRLAREDGGSVGFDARIGPGIVATHNLVEQLRAHGYSRVDCGDRAAYRSRAGLRLVCAVTDERTRRYVVATVRDQTGAVSIRGY